jgi:hypothetical protein
VASTLAALLPRALTNGTWEDVLQLLKPFEGREALLTEQVEGLDNGRVWIEEWKKARTMPTYATQRLATYARIAEECLGLMGKSLPEGSAALAADAGPEFADSYCRRLFEIKNCLSAAVRDLAVRLRAETDVVLGSGDSPALAALYRFTGGNAAGAVETARAFASRLDALDLKLRNESSAVIPLLGIRGGAPQMLPETLTLRNALWTQIGREIEQADDAARREPAGAGARSDRMETVRRQLGSVWSARTSAPAAVGGLPWPAPDDLDDVRQLFALMAAADTE